MAFDIEEWSQVIGLIHESGAAPAQWPAALQGVMKLLGAARASMVDLDSGLGRLLNFQQLGHDPANAKRYAEYYYSIDPTTSACLSAPALQPCTVDECFPVSWRKRSEYFQFHRSCDIGDSIGISTAAVQGVRSMLAFQRTRKARSYGDYEKRLIALIAPHVQSAKRVQLALGHAWSEARELEAAFAQLTMPAFIVDRGATIRHLNAAARNLFAEHEQIMSRGGKLTLSEPKANAAFQDALHKATMKGGRSAALPICFAARDQREILITPLFAGHPVTSPWQIPLVLVVIARGTEDARSIAWRMKQLYGLTPAEARVAADLAMGKSVVEIAMAYKVSTTTLRTQIRAIFGKTGTNRQVDLVRLALSGTVISSHGEA